MVFWKPYSYYHRILAINSSRTFNNGNITGRYLCYEIDLSKNSSEETMFTILDTQPVEDENFEKFYWLPSFVIDLLTCLNEPEDELFCKQLLRAGVMNSLNETFIEFFLQKNTMRVINILAIMSMLALLHTELPEFYCSMVIFIPAIVLYILLYVKFIYEAKVVENEVSSIPRIYTSDNSSCFWIAEAYEDCLLNHCPQDQQYTFMTEEVFNESNINITIFNIKIVGILAFCKSRRSSNMGCIKRLYVQKNYRRKGIGNHLVNQALQFGEEHGFECINTIISEYEKGAMELFSNNEFNINTVHSKPFLMSITLYEYIFLTTHYHPRH